MLLQVLPISGTGPPLAGALLLAMFFNLVAVAGLGRVLSWALRRRRPDVPKVIADDRAGSVLLCTVTLALLAGGIAHAPRADDAERALRSQQRATEAFVVAHGEPAHREQPRAGWTSSSTLRTSFARAYPATGRAASPTCAC